MSQPHLFDIHPWKLEETELNSNTLTLAETLFSLANGYMGTRGTLEESLTDNPSSQEGTYLNGVYMRVPIFYEESAHGFATHNNKMVQVPDAKAIRIFIDDQLFIPSHFAALEHVRHLDFRTGILERNTLWQIDANRKLRVKSRRIVSLADQHLMALEYEVTPIGFDGTIMLESLLGTGHLRHHAKDDFDPRAGHIDTSESLRQLDWEMNKHAMHTLHEVEGSGFIVGSSCTHSCKNGTFIENRSCDESTTFIASFGNELQDGHSISLTKYVSYHHGQRKDEASITKLMYGTLERAEQRGINQLVSTQKEQLDAFWKYGDVSIEGDAALQQGIRFNLFHIFQSSGRDGKRAIAAKGLSGPGYDGHYFWDTEIYIVPFFVYTAPELARKLLEYRYNTLDAARERALQMSHSSGALYAWRTISGEECSAYFPAGTAQYHINAAIAYAIRQYFNATKDWDFMCRYGIEMLLETARFWSELGHFSAMRDNQFCLNEVTGPDEYSAMVDNNFYTNAMARMHLRTAVRCYRELQEEHPDEATRIAKQINLEETELERWQQAAENMYLPYDEAHGIHPQDDGFLAKPRWNFEEMPKDKYPLLLHYHPLIIYRYQVLKQADVVLAMALLGYEFDDDVRKANLDYYTPITTHDSTLSTCIYSVESARAGQYDQAYNFFKDNVRMDIDNLHHNTQYGLHTACMAGSWMSIVMGFSGMECYDNTLHFKPYCPEGWTSYSFNLQFRGAVLRITISHDNTVYTLTHDSPITVYHHQDALTLKPEQPYTMPHIKEEQRYG